MFRKGLLAIALCALTPSLAHAQIYSWRDAAGRLVLSDRPTDPSAKTYALAAGNVTSAFRVTKAAVTRHAEEYADLITQHASENALSPDLVRAVIQAESAFNPRARSPKGAMGLMQLMPETAARYGVGNVYDPAQNIGAGTSYLKSLLTRYNGDESLALAAYNAGPGAVEKYGNTVPPYRETRNYVARIRGNAATSSASHGGQVFRTVTIVDGKETIRYTDRPAASR